MYVPVCTCLFFVVFQGMLVQEKFRWHELLLMFSHPWIRENILPTPVCVIPWISLSVSTGRFQRNRICTDSAGCCWTSGTSMVASHSSPQNPVMQGSVFTMRYTQVLSSTKYKQVLTQYILLCTQYVQLYTHYTIRRSTFLYFCDIYQVQTSTYSYQYLSLLMVWPRLVTALSDWSLTCLSKTWSTSQYVPVYTSTVAVHTLSLQCTLLGFSTKLYWLVSVHRDFIAPSHPTWRWPSCYAHTTRVHTTLYNLTWSWGITHFGLDIG